MHLTLHLTDRCNLACRYCYARPGRADMSLETAIRAIERCAEGPNCGIIFFGGEPLLRKELIWEVIAWCERTQPNRFHYKVTTNGTLLDGEFMDRAERGRLHVALSHDGVRTAHDRMRVGADGAGTFDRLLPALRLLLKRRPYSPVMMTVNPETVDGYAESVRWLQEQGAQYLICSLNYAGPWTDRALRQLKAQYRELAEWHYENYRRERKIYFSPFDKRIATRVFGRGSSCRLGRRQISVGPDGRLYPCVQFVGRGKYAIGTAAGGLDERRREEIYQANEGEKPSCAGCPLNGRCHNKCGCLNVQTTGCITLLPPVLCEHERMVFPIADELAERLFKERDPMFVQRHYNPAFPVLSFLEDLAAS
jgi:uncharacterized protein